MLTQAILPVAGLGTRFLPWTKVVPKELLPIGNEPIIALLVDECIAAGVKEICFVISPGKEAIPQYFYTHPSLEEELRKRGKIDSLKDLQRYDEVQFHVVYQQEQKGDGHAILQALPWVQSEQVAVLFGDDLVHHAVPALVQLKNAHQDASSALLCVERIHPSRTTSYGIIGLDETMSKGRLHTVTSLVEKPDPQSAPSTLGIIGKYIVPKKILESLSLVASSHGGEIRLIDALMKHLGQMPIYAYEIEGERLDTGTPEGYKHAVQVLG